MQEVQVKLTDVKRECLSTVNKNITLPGSGTCRHGSGTGLHPRRGRRSSRRLRRQAQRHPGETHDNRNGRINTDRLHSDTTMQSWPEQRHQEVHIFLLHSWILCPVLRHIQERSRIHGLIVHGAALQQSPAECCTGRFTWW